jgi:uroporphyrinogen decarboxylase
VPLIGFAGSPWTIMCYAVEGKGSKSLKYGQGFFSTSRSSTCFITKLPILQLHKEKSKSGSKCRSNFDSWGGMLSPVDYQEFSWKYINQIIEALADVTPVIVLEKDVGLLNEMGKSRASALDRLDVLTKKCKILVWWKYHFTRNFDPSRLLSQFL